MTINIQINILRYIKHDHTFIQDDCVYISGFQIL